MITTLRLPSGSRALANASAARSIGKRCVTRSATATRREAIQVERPARVVGAAGVGGHDGDLAEVEVVGNDLPTLVGRRHREEQEGAARRNGVESGPDRLALAGSDEHEVEAGRQRAEVHVDRLVRSACPRQFQARGNSIGRGDARSAERAPQAHRQLPRGAAAHDEERPPGREASPAKRLDDGCQGLRPARLFVREPGRDLEGVVAEVARRDPHHLRHPARIETRGLPRRAVHEPPARQSGQARQGAW